MFHNLLGPVLASTSRRVIVLHRSQQSSLCKHANSRCSTRFWALSLRRRPDESSSSIAGNKALFANMPILDVALRHKPCMQHETATISKFTVYCYTKVHAQDIMFLKLLGPVLASTSRRVVVLHRSQQKLPLQTCQCYMLLSDISRACKTQLRQ